MRFKIFLVLLFLHSNNAFSDCTSYRTNVSGFFSNCNSLDNISLTFRRNNVYPEGYDLICDTVRVGPSGQAYFYTQVVHITAVCQAGTQEPIKVAIQNPKPETTCGSIIQTSNQVVGENISLVGTNFDLTYFSNKVIGRKADYRSNINISLSSVPTTVTGYGLTIKDENDVNILDTTLGTTPNLIYNYEWNGVNSSSLETWGSIKRTVQVKEYATDFEIPPIPYSISIGGLKAKKLGLGGWVPSIWHFYDVNSKTLYKGDGSTRVVTEIIDGNYTRIADESGSLVFYFDSMGRLSHTKTSLTGSTLFTFNYDTSGRLASIIEPFNKTTTFNRLSNGNLTEIIAPNGSSTTVTIDANGYLNHVENALNEVHSMTYYGTEGLLKTFTVPSGDVTTLTYDTNGNLISDVHINSFSAALAKTSTGTISTSAMGKVFSSLYTPGGNVETTIRPSGLQEIVGNYANSKQQISPLIDETIQYLNDPRFGDQAKYTSSIITDNFGYRNTTIQRTASLQNPNDIFSINTLNNTFTTGQSVNTSTYNGLTRTNTFTTRVGRTRKIQIDQYERPILSQIGNQTAKNYVYTNEQLTKISEGPRETNFTYNSENLIETIENSLNQITTFGYDSAQKLKTTTLPDSRVIEYTYDFNGNLTRIFHSYAVKKPFGSDVEAGALDHVLNYGLNDKLASYVTPQLPDGTTYTTNYTYNNDKQLTKISRPDGKEINLNYNLTTGLMTSIAGAFGTITKSYSNELPSLVTDQYGHTVQTSYSRSTPISTTLSKNNVNFYSYARTPDTNAGEKIATETITGFGTGSVQQVINYGYDFDEYLTSAGAMALTYNTPNGQLTGSTLGNINDLYTYNSFGEIATYQAKDGATVLYEYSLTRDAIGRVSQKVETLNNITTTFDYFYDESGRLIEVDTDGSVSSAYSYDDHSNRIDSTIRGEVFNATYDRHDRLTNYNGTALTYNANGDILTNGTATYDYDIFGNLKQYVNGSMNLTYEIDPNQRRLGKIVNGSLDKRFGYNPEGQVVGELNSSNQLVKTFVYGSKKHVPDYYIDSSNNKFRIISDYLGSVRMVVSSAGVVQQVMEHDEFGRVLQDTNSGVTPFGYAGGLYDSQSGLVRFGVRDYDPETGRFTSKDPIGFNGGDANLYGYVLNNPANFVDPNGTNPLLIPVATGLVGGFVGGVAGYNLSSSNTTAGRWGDAFIGAGVGAAGGFFAGVGAVGAIIGTTTGAVASGAQVLGGLAIDAGINAWGLGNLINGGNNPTNACSGK